jgi:hypothetical protein
LDHPAQPCGRAVRELLYKSRAKSVPKEKPFGINRKCQSADFHSTKDCCRLLQQWRQADGFLCSAKI